MRIIFFITLSAFLYSCNSQPETEIKDCGATPYDLREMLIERSIVEHCSAGGKMTVFTNLETKYFASKAMLNICDIDTFKIIAEEAAFMAECILLPVDEWMPLLEDK
tara:strand:- start:576 stop:896 length:321 start_codon:yes stop_codon:yes gene_type:complete